MIGNFNLLLNKCDRYLLKVQLHDFVSITEAQRRKELLFDLVRSLVKFNLILSRAKTQRLPRIL